MSGTVPKGALRRFLRDGIWSFAGQTVAIGGLLVGTRMLTDRLAPDVFGAVGLLVGVSTLGYNMFCAPLLQGYLRFYPELHARSELGVLHAVVERELVSTTGLVVAILLVAGVFIRYGAGVPFGAFLALALLTSIEAARTFDLAYLQSAPDHRRYSVWVALEAWARPVAAIALIAATDSSASTVLAGYFAGTLALYLVLRNRRFSGGGTAVAGARHGELRRALWTYAWPLVPVAMVNWVCSLSDRYIIGWFHGVADVGVYAAAYGLAGRPMIMISTVLTNLFRPVVFGAFSDRRFADARRWLRRWLFITFGSGVLVVVAFYFGAGLVVRLALNVRYRAVAPLLPFIAGGYVLLALSQVLNIASMAYRRTSATTISETSGAVASFAIGIPLIAWKSIAGAAYAVPLYYGVQCLVSALLERSHARAHACALTAEDSSGC